MLRYKFDPCADDDLGLDDLLDPLDTRNQEARTLKSYTPLLIGAGVIFIVALALLLFAPTKSNS